MAKTSSIPLPAAHALRKLGRDLALARRKRGISTSDMAARLFVARNTLWRLERGDPTVALGTLMTAAFVLNHIDIKHDLLSKARNHHFFAMAITRSARSSSAKWRCSFGR
jgi:transcriptional regulator with XRE-family HTH domain